MVIKLIINANKKDRQMLFYAIRHKGTGNYLPALNKLKFIQGTTFWEGEEDGVGKVPRLYQTVRSAKCFITYWLKGKHSGRYSTMTVASRSNRKREHLEIVPMKLEPQI